MLSTKAVPQNKASSVYQLVGLITWWLWGGVMVVYVCAHVCARVPYTCMRAPVHMFCM